jgi:FMN phosphatase YigB (HAD superfamily)
MNTTKYIFFDIGGVVVLDYSKTNKWNEMLSDLWMNDNQKRIFEETFREYENRICAWKVTTQEFIKHLQLHSDIKFANDYSMLDDFISRFESNTRLIPLLEKLSTLYEIWLLTNMYPWMLEWIKNKWLLPNLWWHSIIDSSHVWFSKPDRDIFLLAEKRCWYKAHEILFVENTTSHIEAANSLWWNTFLYDPSNVEVSNDSLERLLIGK